MFEILAGMEHAVPHRADLRNVVERALLFIEHGAEHQFHRLLMGGHILFDDEFPAVEGLLREHAALEGDALAHALQHDTFVFHIDELVLQRRTARVDNQDLHRRSPRFSNAAPAAP